MRQNRVIMLLVLVLAGCGGEPTIDATSAATMEASLLRIAGPMTQEQKERFAMDCLTLTTPQLLGQPTATADPDAWKSLHGLTARQVRDMAEVERAKAAR